MKQNKGFTLVELIIVLACLTGVLGFFWKILESSSKDAYTINEKMEVQNSVVSLMNTIQQDTQEAKIIQVAANTYVIFIATIDSDMIDENKRYEFGDTTNKKIYEFDANDKTVTRTVINGEDTEIGTYDNIIGFEMTQPKESNKSKYGVNVNIIGGKKDYRTSELDKSRYSLNSTFYTRNTYVNNN